ncbi:hypothetical protein WIS52_02585 [Pseudonocardia nematodicida]|uniref:Uncharacterized protein n=1 Tax=Pseudonocardia nematodicida TaxID=1206997 RepID=A0ABV1K4G6_9PSEU
MRDLLCERCWSPIDRTREPLRMSTVRSYVHALPCLPPDTGEWDSGRRGLSPAAIRHAAASADHR